MSEIKEEQEEDCEPCKLSVAIGMYLNVCSQVSEKKECDELFDKLTKEEITADDVFKIVKEKVKDKPDQKEILDYIDALVKGDEKIE